MVVNRLNDLRNSRILSSTEFPISQGRNYLRLPLFPQGEKGGYFSKFYVEDVINPLTIDFRRFKLEVLAGQQCPAGHVHRVDIKTPSAVPYAITNTDPANMKGRYSARVRMNGKDLALNNLVSERFYYLPIREPGIVELQSPHDLVIGNSIPLTQDKRHRHKLVLVLFIDSFTSEVFSHIDFEKDLPNIHQFFSKGMLFRNCFSSSNWTLPGVATLFSGQSLLSHRMFHPLKNIVLGDGYPLLSELFQHDEYLTFQACGNWRKTPAHGYVKGFDRTIYKRQLTIGEGLHAFLDHLRAFPDRDHFAWISIFDAHHHLSFLPEIANQILAPLEAQDYSEQDAKTPMQLKPNESKTLRYIQELKRIDFYLGFLFRYLEEAFNDDELLVSIVSDHGTGHFVDDQAPLSREKVQVPFFIRGGGVPVGHSDEIIQNTDIFPALAACAGLSLDADMDGRTPETLGGPPARNHAITENLYPGDPYNATIKDERFDFYFETNALTDDDGQVDLSRFSSSLFLKAHWTKNVAADHPDMVGKFETVVLDRFARRLQAQ